MKSIKILFRKHFIGIKNLIKFFPIVYNYRNYDFGYIECSLSFQLKDMYKRFSNPNKTTVDWNYNRIHQKQLQALKIAINILKRREDFWYDSVNANDYKLTKEIEQRDWSIFCNILNKHFTNWWD